MRRQITSLQITLLIAASCLTGWTADTRAADENLLALPGVQVVPSALNPPDTLLSALRDGNVRTSAKLAESFEFVLDMGQVVTARRFIVHLAGGAKVSTDALAEVELLGSLTSASAGFQLLRRGTLGKRKADLRFNPLGTRWIMVRVTLLPDVDTAPVSEIEVVGQQGPPSTRYAFQQSPASAATMLNELRRRLNIQTGADESALFADAADGRLDNWTLAEAALLASGVTDSNRRAGYLQRLSNLQDTILPTLNQQPDTLARGQALLQQLHRTALHAGYVEAQTDFSVLLDSGSYNCVSSAVLYSILGRRAGLDVRGIEVPDHAFAILYDGTRHADVETTTEAGFNPARNKKSADAFTARTGFAYIPESRSNQRRETSALGLVALIYYNHGVNHGRAGQPLAALQSYFRALSLDPNMLSATKNALAEMANWANQLSEAREHEKALELVNAGLSLAPEDRTLRHNRKVFWQRRIIEAMDHADVDTVIALTRAAHQAVPDAGFDSQEGDFYIRRGQRLADAGQWQQALALVTRGSTQVNNSSQRQLQRFSSSVVLQWMADAIERRRWQESMQALSEGLTLRPDEYRLKRNAAYLLQEWSEAEFASAGIAAGAAAAETMLQRYPDNNQVRRAANDYLVRRVIGLRDAGNRDGALAAIDQYAMLLKNPREASRLKESLFADDADKLLKAGEWAQALDVYENSRSAFPDGTKAARLYQQNVAYAAQEWFAETPDSQFEPLASTLLQRFDDVSKLPRIVAASYSRRLDAHHEAGDFEASAALAARAAEVLDNNLARNLLRRAYDGWSAHHRERGEWQQATRVYAAALQAAPNDGHLKRNAAATWHAWAKPHIDRKEWQVAIDIYEQGLQQMPGNRQFEQNIRYCRQEMGGE